MNRWFWAALGFLLALLPTGIVCFRGKLGDRLAGLGMASVLITFEFVLLTEGLRRSPFFDVPLTLAVLTFGGGLVFARFVERWL